MLTVLCSDLLLKPAEIAAWPSAVARRLACARVLNDFHDDSPIPLLTPAEAWLKQQFSLPPDPALTISAYRRFCYPPAPGDEPAQLPAASQILTATPSYLHATLDHLVLTPAPMLSVTGEQANALASAANEFFAQDDVRLQVLAPDCWLLIMPTALNLQLHGSLQAAGRNIHAYMPAGPDGRRLRALLNELQMVWHDHPVNRQRASDGDVPINSLWIEGTVHLGDRDLGDGNVGAPFQQVISDSPVTRGLATGCGVSRISPIPADGSALSALATGQPETLIELSGPNTIAHLEGLLDAATASLAVVLCDQRSRLELRSTPSDRFRFWRSNALARLPAEPS